MTIVEFVLANIAVMFPIFLLLFSINSKIKKDVLLLKIYMIQVLKKLDIPFIEN